MIALLGLSKFSILNSLITSPVSIPIFLVIPIKLSTVILPSIFFKVIPAYLLKNTDFQNFFYLSQKVYTDPRTLFSLLQHPSTTTCAINNDIAIKIKIIISYHLSLFINQPCVAEVNTKIAIREVIKIHATNFLYQLIIIHY